MKNNKTKKICTVFMLLCLLTAYVSASLQTLYAAKKSDRTNYAAFGDSIAAGYSLDGYADGQATVPSDSYQALVAAFLKTQSGNYAVSGDNSDDCLALLRSGKADQDLADADVITLSIGSNDLLLPFIQILMDFFLANPEIIGYALTDPASTDPASTDPASTDPASIDPSFIEEQLKNGFEFPQIDMTKIAEYYKKAEELLALLSDNETLHTHAAAFSEKFQTILSILKEKAPNAEIYATNVYNPFAFVPKIGELADLYIQEINQAFSADASAYTLIDVYTPFHEQSLTNVQIDLKQPDRVQLDPHPSVQGHAKIAELIMNALKQAHAPKTAVLNSLSSGSKYKLTVKAKLPADADGYQVLYAAKKKGSYKSLGTTDKKTFQTNAKKLKAKKNYYIKTRSFKVIKGVTYYGADSSIKKITIK